MKQELSAPTCDLLAFGTDMFHMVSLLDARSSDKTTGTANSKNSYRVVRIDYVLGTEI